MGSDVEGDVSAPAAAVGGPMDLNTAVQEVLKQALMTDGLARGLHEAVKALDKRQALLCLLANNCDEPGYTKLVEALCQEYQIRLLKVDSNKILGEWAGLCKIDCMERLARLLAAHVSLLLSMERKPKLMILSTITSRARDSKPEVIASHLL